MCYVQNSPNVTSEAGTGSSFPWVCLVQVLGGFLLHYSAHVLPEGWHKWTDSSACPSFS